MQEIEINFFILFNSLKGRRHLVLLHLKTNLSICLRLADVYQCISNLILWGKCPNHQDVPHYPGIISRPGPSSSSPDPDRHETNFKFLNTKKNWIFGNLILVKSAKHKEKS